MWTWFKICADLIRNLQRYSKEKKLSHLCVVRNETCPSVTCLRLKHWPSNPGWPFLRRGASALAPAGGPQTRRSILTPSLAPDWPKLVLVLHPPVCHCAEAGVGGRATSLNLLTSICQFGSFLADRWRRACLVKWSLLMNRRSHIGQANFFSPVCVRRCLDSSSERANLLSHPFQLQLKGFSPVCVLTWAFRWELLK